MVSFLDDPESYDNNASIRHLDREIHRIGELSRKVRDLDDHITTSEKYIQKVGGVGGGGSSSSSSDQNTLWTTGMELDDSDKHLGRLLSL
jgi:hypothetical protein